MENIFIFLYCDCPVNDYIWHEISIAMDVVAILHDIIFNHHTNKLPVLKTNRKLQQGLN